MLFCQDACVFLLPTSKILMFGGSLGIIKTVRLIYFPNLHAQFSGSTLFATLCIFFFWHCDLLSVKDLERISCFGLFFICFVD
uniref:Uncharacterized protein n=1 Tax=Rhizophora mucronata TaxID=61149 RepID=A0A2P2QN92_RHIMU